MVRRIQVNTGDKYGRLTVIDEAAIYESPNGEPKRQFNCQCSCGDIITVGLRHLRSGATTACMACNHKTHGQSRRSGAYSSWDGMIQRCCNQNDDAYHHYGGRGISVCERWRLSFASFYTDMGDRPDGYTIERIETDGHYEPGNCRWATQKEQLRNTRRTVWLTHAGQTKSLGEWAEISGIRYATLWSRIQILGMSAEEAITGGKTS